MSGVTRAFLRSLARRVGGEPLVLFALPAVLIFLAYSLLASPDEETIVIGLETIEALVAARQEVLLRPLTEAERAAVVEEHVQNELLLREALARGFHLSDPQVRERLIDRMRILLADEPPAPDEDDLRAFYAANPDVYRSEPTVTFDHVFFEAGTAAGRMQEVLDALRAGATPRGRGDRFWLGNHFERYSRRELIAVLGRGFADAVFAAEPGTWQGPLQSTRGLHLVRVNEVSEARQLPFEQLRPYIQADWLAARREASVAAKLERIRDRYRILIEDEAAP